MDVIKRKDAIKVVERCKHRLNGNGSTYEIMLDMVNAIPSAEPTAKVTAEVKVDTEDVIRRIKEEYNLVEPKRGEWVDAHGNLVNDSYAVYCSLCGQWSEYRTDFCPNCGAVCRKEQSE